MSSKQLIVLFTLIVSYPLLHAKTVEDGRYQLVAVRCHDDSALRYAHTVQFHDIDKLMIQASVPGRDSLKPYYFAMTLVKSDQSVKEYWSQLHTGNATNDARNHAPFYSTFTTQGRIDGDYIRDMKLLPDSTKILYLEEDYNHQAFTPSDITDRMAKTKHLGTYSTQFTWRRITDSSGPYATRPLYELAELDGGFGAPRHLLCAAVDAKMSYVFTPVQE